MKPLSPVATSTTLPDCMVVIPARDEEESIERAVRSFPADTVIVVDDDSSDRTAEIAKQAGSGVISTGPLPPLTIGKAHACMVGARVIATKWILFADADTWYAPGFLDAAIACAESNGLEFLFIEPKARSYRAAVMALARNPLASAGGRCILARRDAYTFLGGHTAVLQSVAEDMKLAAIAQRHRMKVSIVRAGKLASVLRFRKGSDSVARELYRLTQGQAAATFLIPIAALLLAGFFPSVLGGLWKLAVGRPVFWKTRRVL